MSGTSPPGDKPKTPPLGVAALVPPAAPSSPRAHDPPPSGIPRPRSSPGMAAIPASSAGLPALPLSSPGTAALVPPVSSRITVQYPQPGSTLASRRGSYVVRAVLGSGEFGAVYQATGPFDQIYALKMIRPANRPYGEVHAEWLRETQRLLSLRHPNVVYIYDAFEQDHLFYLALERCDHPLRAMLGAPLQEGLVCELARQILAAVQFLHDNDVVHGDLHAGNVLVTQHVDRPLAKITDFGISHELRGAPGVRPPVVHHAIMAPEILATGFTTKQSDLYQLGLLLYWMLAGTPALAPELPYAELVRQVSEGEPRRRAEALGTPLGGLVAKLLRRRDTYRYTSAREVWTEMRELPPWRDRQLFPVK